MKKHILSLAVLMLLVQAPLSAQSLSQDDIDAITEKVKQKVNVFQNELAIIVNNENSMNTRNQAVADALSLFIGKGDPYRYKDMNGSWLQHDAVTMQTTSKIRGIITRPMKCYLEITKNQASKAKITIKQAQAVRVDNFEPDPADDSRFLATVTYFQTYKREYDWGTYVDHDTKTMKVYIERRSCQTPEGTLSVYVIQLGDVVSVASSNY